MFQDIFIFSDQIFVNPYPYLYARGNIFAKMLPGRMSNFPFP